MSNYDDDPDIQAAINQAAIAMLGEEVRGDTGGNPANLERARLAATEICRRAGILDTLRAISADGELRPPPTWPDADIVPVGGGVGFLNVDVRTHVAGRGTIRIPLRMAIKGKPTQAQIGEAYDRGYWHLQRAIIGKVLK